MNIETARGIAARIWCDPEYANVVMNPDLAEKIAGMLVNEHKAQFDERGVIFDDLGHILYVPPSSAIHKGSSRCNRCRTVMPVFWDTICCMCRGTHCYDCSEAINGRWFCEKCAGQFRILKEMNEF